MENENRSNHQTGILVTVDDVVYELSDGKLSFESRFREDGRYIEISGVLSTMTAMNYIERLESKRYILSGIHINKMSFGSEEDTIVYEFDADEIEIKED